MKIAIVGGGPAGLRAAEVAASNGAHVTLFEAKASVGRKFLVAGRGGLNITKSEPLDRFVAQYRSPEFPASFWPSALASFDPAALRDWAAGLGVETFVASTGRVYPIEMKAAPLLRRWVHRLRDLGVHFAMHHCWTGLREGSPLRLEFENQGQTQEQETDAVIFALGGGSWPRTGSDGKWVNTLEELGVAIAPLAAANCGWEYAWPLQVLEKAEGLPLKNIRVRAGRSEAFGELLVTKYGIEGGAVYQVGAALREMDRPVLSIDFKPSFSVEQLVLKLGGARRDLFSEARQRWKLSACAMAILESSPSCADSAESLARAVKEWDIPLEKPRPLEEAISSAGGVKAEEVDETLMLKRVPGVFFAGEMLDWEAPTGGYLMQGCFATGDLAARGAVAWCQ